jgi:ATP-dependent RNA helicase DbpA
MTATSDTAIDGGPAFSTLALPEPVLTNLEHLGYRHMTPIQAASLPLALAGKDLIAQAKTGSGKTAAFALALLARLDARRFAVQALVLCPTRELAEQVSQEIRRLARADDNVKVLTLCGGAAVRPQLARLASCGRTARTSWWAHRGASSTTSGANRWRSTR